MYSVPHQQNKKADRGEDNASWFRHGGEKFLHNHATTGTGWIA
jgi:hypothetical protein